MVKRQVRFTVTAQETEHSEQVYCVSPTIPQYGGVKGEHNATEVLLTLENMYQAGELVRLSFTAGDGTVVSSDLLDDVMVAENVLCIDYKLPQLLTVAAGQLCMRVVLSRLDENGEEEIVVRSPEMVLWFEESSIENGTPFWTGVSEMLHRTVAAKDAVVAAQETIVGDKSAAQDAAAKAIVARDAAYSSAQTASQQATAAKGSAQAAQTAAAQAQEAVDTPGRRGASAYEIAVENGFEGDEGAWIASLKGDKGDKGDPYTLTQADKAEIVDDVLAAIPSGGTDFNTICDSYGKKWLFIGDSITEHNFRASKNYDQFLTEWLGIVSVNRGMSSTGVTHSLTNSPIWLDDLQNYPADVDVISVMGALNDRHTALGEWGDRGTDTVYGGVWNYFNNLIAKYPNKPIIYITSTPREYSYGVDGQYTAWVDAFIKTAHNFSIPVLDLYRESGLRPWNATNNKTYFSCSSAPNGDGVHPNALGQELMAQKILEFAKAHLFAVVEVSNGNTGGDTGGDTPDEYVANWWTIGDANAWEEGALVNGAETTNANRIRTQLIDVSGFDKVAFHIVDGYEAAVVWFNGENGTTYVNTSGYTKRIYYADVQYSHCRIVVKRIDNANMSAYEGAIAIAPIDTNTSGTLESSNWQVGALLSGVNKDDTTRIRTIVGYLVNGLNSITVSFDSSVYKVAIYFYNEYPVATTSSINTPSYITTSGHTETVPNGATHARFVLARVDNATMSIEEHSMLTVTH